jgi:hypothetical protein
MSYFASDFEDSGQYVWPNGFTLSAACLGEDCAQHRFMMWGVTADMAGKWTAAHLDDALALLGIRFHITKCHGVTHLVCDGPGYEYLSNKVDRTPHLMQALLKTLGLDVSEAEISGSMPALCTDKVAEPMSNRVDQLGLYLIDDELMMGVITALLVISLCVALHVPVVDTVRHTMSRASRYASRLFNGDDHGAPQADVGRANDGGGVNNDAH